MVDREIFSYDAPYTQLNFPSEGGVTAYFSRNMTKDDLVKVKAFLMSEVATEKGLNILNTRVFKKESGVYLITVASVIEEGSFQVEYEGC